MMTSYTTWQRSQSVLMLMCLLVASSWILGCTTGHVDPDRASDGLGLVAGSQSHGDRLDSAKTVLPEGKADVGLVRSGENTILSLPVTAETDVSPRVQGNELQLTFSPPLPGLGLPATGTGLVSSLQADSSSSATGEVSQLSVRLKERFRFMFSKPSPETLRVYFFPDRKGETRPLSSGSIGSSEAGDRFSVQDIKFTRNGQGHLLVRVSTGHRVNTTPVPDDEDRIRILLPEVSVPAWFAKLYNLRKFSTEVRSALFRNGQDGAELLFSVQKRVPMQVNSTPDGVLITLLTSPSVSMEDSNMPSLLTADTTPGRGSDETDNDLQELNTLFPGMKTNYTGAPVSLDFQDADIEHVLRLLAEISGYNLILDEGVTGTISLKLKDLPWDHALDLILVQKGLGMVLKGNIMRIATAKKLEEERNQITRARKAALEAKESFENLAPLETSYIQVNYSTAAELEPKVKEFLSPRGKVSPDSRTNILIVSDTRAQLNKIRRVLEKLDRAERQVRIEARIVYATDEFKRNLGVKWGGSYSPSWGGEQWSNSVGVSALNLPTPITDFAVTGSIAKILGDDLFSLDMELQLGETTGISKTISAPKVVTLNNKEAEIEQTTQIPYNTLDEAGNTITEFKEAPLKLRVTPQITPDNKLLLDIEVNDDTATTTTSSEEPAIESKRIQSKLIVDNKETIVIGGIQRVTRTTNQNRIPGAADIPVMGWLFKNQEKDVSKQELLVFIRCEVL